jgi:hypothetical protein
VGSATHVAESDTALYWVHDAPLLTYLGVRADAPHFKPTLYKHENEDRELKKIQSDPLAGSRSRVSALLANKNFNQTETITYVLWAMYGVLPKDAVQLPHRHQSAALDLIIDCEPGCYSLLGEELDSQQNIIRPLRADWKTGLGITHKGDLRLVPKHDYLIFNGSTDEVKITDLGGCFVDPARLRHRDAATLAHFYNGASKASAHLTWKSGHKLNERTFKDAVPLIRRQVISHFPEKIAKDLTSRCSQRSPTIRPAACAPGAPSGAVADQRG